MKVASNTMSIVMLIILVVVSLFWDNPYKCKDIRDLNNCINNHIDCIMLARVYNALLEDSRLIHKSTQNDLFLSQDITYNDIHLNEISLFGDSIHKDIYNNDEYVLLFKDDKLYLTHYRTYDEYYKYSNMILGITICLILLFVLAALIYPQGGY